MGKNKMILGITSIVLIAFLLCLQSCELDTNKYSDVPHIDFLNSEVSQGYDSLQERVHKLTLEFYLIDGDGDMGLPNEKLSPPYVGDSAFNFFPTLYYIRAGEFLKDTIATIDSAKNYIIPFIEQVGLDRTLKANVFIDFDFNIKLFHYDSIVYSFYVMDRAFHKSNVEWTDTIVIGANK